MFHISKFCVTNSLHVEKVSVYLFKSHWRPKFRLLTLYKRLKLVYQASLSCQGQWWGRFGPIYAWTHRLLLVAIASIFIIIFILFLSVLFIMFVLAQLYVAEVCLLSLRTSWLYRSDKSSWLRAAFIITKEKRSICSCIMSASAQICLCHMLGLLV